MIIYAWSHPPKVSELELQQKTCLLTVGASLQTKVNFFWYNIQLCNTVWQ